MVTVTLCGDLMQVWRDCADTCGAEGMEATSDGVMAWVNERLECVRRSCAGNGLTEPKHVALVLEVCGGERLYEDHAALHRCVAVRLRFQLQRHAWRTAELMGKAPSADTLLLAEERQPLEHTDELSLGEITSGLEADEEGGHEAGGTTVNCRPK